MLSQTILLHTVLLSSGTNILRKSNKQQNNYTSSSSFWFAFCKLNNSHQNIFSIVVSKSVETGCSDTALLQKNTILLLLLTTMILYIQFIRVLISNNSDKKNDIQYAFSGFYLLSTYLSYWWVYLMIFWTTEMEKG